MPDSNDILQTLIELLEAQEQIKVEYKIGGEINAVISTPNRGA